MYDDFKLIDENKFLEIKKAYGDKLNKTKVLNEEENFNERFLTLQNLLSKSLHYLKNLIKLCNNAEDKNILENIYTSLIDVFNNLKSLYEIDEEINIEEVKNKDLDTINTNLKGINLAMLDFLDEIFSLYDYETNIKIKFALKKILKTIINNVKILNKQIKNINTFKVISLFKKYD